MVESLKRVYICSRYRADERHTVESNIDRALYACAIAVDRGCAPIAPHLLYPQFLDDNDPEERKQGIEAGMAWIEACDELWQWGATVSEGMAKEIARAKELGIPVKIFNSVGIPKERWYDERLYKEAMEGCNTTAR